MPAHISSQLVLHSPERAQSKKANMLNYFKISLHFLHIKIKSARTRKLEYFCFHYCHFELFSTLRDVSTPKRVQLQAEAGERCHSPSQVIFQLGGHTGSTGEGTGHPLQPPS